MGRIPVICELDETVAVNSMVLLTLFMKFRLTSMKTCNALCGIRKWILHYKGFRIHLGIHIIAVWIGLHILLLQFHQEPVLKGTGWDVEFLRFLLT